MKSKNAIIKTPIRKLRTLNRITRFHLRERFYGDGIPHWRVTKKDHPCETSEEAEASWRIALNRLWRLSTEAVSNEAEAARLKNIADIIEACRPQGRCHHPACPLCLRAFQRWFVWTAPVALKVASRKCGAGLEVVCIIPDLRLTTAASLDHSRDQVARVLAKFDRAFDPTTGLCMIGGVDISVNVSEKTDVERELDVARVQLHVWALAPADQIHDLKPWLKSCFPTSRITKDPIKTQVWDGDIRAFAYALKTGFLRRISLRAKMRNGRFCRNTRNKPLSVNQWGRVMLIQEMIGSRRLILVNAEITTNSTGHPVIRPMKHKKTTSKARTRRSSLSPF